MSLRTARRSVAACVSWLPESWRTHSARLVTCPQRCTCLTTPPCPRSTGLFVLCVHQTQARVKEAVAAAAEAAAVKTAEQWQLRMKQELAAAAEAIRVARNEAESAKSLLAVKEREAEARQREMESVVAATRDKAEREYQRLEATNHKLMEMMKDGKVGGGKTPDRSGGHKQASPPHSLPQDLSMWTMLLKAATTPQPMSVPAPPPAPTMDHSTTQALADIRSQLSSLSSQILSASAAAPAYTAPPPPPSIYRTPSLSMGGGRTAVQAVDDDVDTVIESLGMSIADRSTRLSKLAPPRGLNTSDLSAVRGSTTLDADVSGFENRGHPSVLESSVLSSGRPPLRAAATSRDNNSSWYRPGYWESKYLS